MELITDTNPIRGMAYALHDTFGYNERWSTDEGAKELIRHLREHGFTVVRSDEIGNVWGEGYQQGRNDVYDEEGY